MQRIIVGIFLGVVFFVSIALFVFLSKDARAGLNAKVEIMSIDLSKDKSLVILNKYLLNGDMLAYFRARQRLLSLSYEELSDLKKRVWKIRGLKEISGFLEDILGQLEKKGLYLIQESCLINNTPGLPKHPFYGDFGEDFNITELKPDAEHLYFNNLRLKYKKNNLLYFPDGRWLSANNKDIVEDKNTKSEVLQVTHPQFSTQKDPPICAWSYKLREDNQIPYLFDARQWIKMYEENALNPVVYQETVLLRNEYRLFCVDLLSGEELWSFTDKHSLRQEFYQTFRHPHLNTYGYELLQVDDSIFTELGGKLVRIKLRNIYAPRLLWERSLGEFTLCTKPILSNAILIAGLINAQGELWICGFNYENGLLEWSTYIGLSSFLSIACELSVLENNRVFIGTNHGVLACLSSQQGNIIWLKNYTPKAHSIFDLWGARNSIDSGILVYDTQFLEVENKSRLYYKPRESDYVYVLDINNGATLDEILIDSDKYYILGVVQGGGVFLEKTNNALKNVSLKFVDLGSGAQRYSQKLKAGKLQGVLRPQPNELLFKIDDTVHFLNLGSKRVNYTKLKIPISGWLLDALGRFLFIGQGNTLFCLNIFREKLTSTRSDLGHNEYIDKRNKLKADLDSSCHLNIDDSRLRTLQKKILDDIIMFRCPLDVIFPTIVNNLEGFRRPAWNNFFTQLAGLYPQEVVTCRDIQMLFTNFIQAAGIINDSPGKPKKETGSLINKKNSVRKQKNFRVRGEKMYLLPVKVLSGAKTPRFFLLLNRDQLLCVGESGDILWAKKVFYDPYLFITSEIEYETDTAQGRMYVGDIEAYLYEGILIVNDHVNVIAINSQDGGYIWSMTNKTSLFEQEKQLPKDNLDSLYKKYGIRKSFLKNTMLYVKIINDQLILIRGNKLYSVEPKTGYCKLVRELGIEGAISVTVANEKIYLVSYNLDKLIVLDGELKPVGDFSLDFIADKQVYPELNIIKDYILMHINSTVYLINSHTGALCQKLMLEGKTKDYLDVLGDNLLIISPFKKLASYRIADGLLALNYEFDLGTIDKDIQWKYAEKKSHYYFLVGNQVILFSRRNKEYFIVSVDAQTGKAIWQEQLSGAKGVFYDLTNYYKSDGVINFIMTTGGNESFSAEFISVDSKLYQVNLFTGKSMLQRSLPGTNFERVSRKSEIVETAECFIYVVNGLYLNVERKGTCTEVIGN